MTAAQQLPALAAPATGTTVTCVFAILGGDGPAAPAAGPESGQEGGHEGGGALRLLPLAARLRALVQDVPAADFTEDALRRRLADPARLEVCARAHHAVVTAAAAGGPVVPLPLATLFTDDRRAVAALDARRQQFLAALELVTGRAEWALKVSVGRPEASAAPAAGRPSPAPAGGQGAAYLARVRGRERDRTARQEAALRAARHAHDTAAAFAVSSVRRRPHGTEVTGRDRHQVLNAAYLVDDARAAELASAVRALAGTYRDLGLHVELSGPWVPYSFTGQAAGEGE
jgi:hypothetical protein